MKFPDLPLLQRELHLSSEESVLSNQSQQGCEMLQFDSWGYESVIWCYHFLTVTLTLLPFIRISHARLKGRIYYY
jgi:hypothetical protein